MTLIEKLFELKACPDSLDWVGDKTIEEAWSTCERSDWMIWFLAKTDLDLIDPICDIAERVLHLVPENNRWVCSNAIDAARRRANQSELSAACNAFDDSIYSYNATYAFYAAVLYAAAHSSVYAAAHSLFSVAHAAAHAAADAACSDSSYRNEQKKQCDIIRKYFTVDQVRAAFNKLVP